MNKIRVLIVDDHDVVRLGLQLLFSRMEQYEVIAEAKNAREAVEMALETRPDLILMDVRLPDKSGIEACREILQFHPGTKVLMLTSYGDEEAVMASLIAGARGFVVKEIKSGELLDAIRRVTRGEYLLDPTATDRMVQGIIKKQQGKPGKVGNLTPKEYEIFCFWPREKPIGKLQILSFSVKRQCEITSATSSINWNWAAGHRWYLLLPGRGSVPTAEPLAGGTRDKCP